MEAKRKEFAGVILAPFCTLRCLFCNPNRKKLPDEEIKKQVDKVYKNIKDFIEEGYKKIEISGSDPLEYDQIWEVISYLKSNGFEDVRLSTNGIKLANKNILKKIVKSGVDLIRIPLYGSTAEIHDCITRTKGSFNDVISGIKGIKKEGANIQLMLTSLIMQPNREDVIGILNLMRDLGADEIFFSIPCIAQKDDVAPYVPYQELKIPVRNLSSYAIKNGYNIKFLDIPFCVFGYYNTFAENTNFPPNLGKYNQPPQQHKTNIPDLPAYRLKSKVDICKRCKANNECDGLYINYIEAFGSDGLEPIKSKLKGYILSRKVSKFPPKICE